MPPYKEQYFHLFNAITDAIELLKQAQLNSEADFLDWPEQPPIQLSDKTNEPSK